MTPSRAAALLGTVSVAVAIGTGELLAGLFGSVPSPVDAIGQVLIPRFPGAVTSWAISLFGSANRAVLTGAIVFIALLIGAYAGTAARRSFASPAVLFCAFAIFGAIASLGQPGARLIPVVLTAGALAAAGLVTLQRGLGRVAGLSQAHTTSASSPHITSADGVAGESQTMTPPGPVPSLDRRAFLNAMAGTGVAALGAVALGRWVLGGGGTIDLAGIRLPAPRRSLPALTATTDASGQVPGLSPILTPTDRFFRIDTALSVPRVDPETWSFRVTGMVEQELSFSYDELLAEPMDEYDVTIACVSNGVGGDLIGTARWLGTPLAAILERAGIESGATQIVGRSVDGWTAGFPTEVALDGRDAIIAVAMNGEPLPPRHGFPARLIIPGLFGYVSATKWLSEIELTTWEAYDAYWVPRGWSKEGPVKTGSRIDTPVRGDEVSAGETVVAGVAWAPGRGIERVEVRVDEGAWQRAELIEPLADTAWVQWRTSLDLAPGQNAIEVRATDGRGEVQPEGPQPPAPNGAEGWHRVTVTGQA